MASSKGLAKHLCPGFTRNHRGSHGAESVSKLYSQTQRSPNVQTHVGAHKLQRSASLGSFRRCLSLVQVQGPVFVL